jgi:hypothetical protein
MAKQAPAKLILWLVSKKNYRKKNTFQIQLKESSQEHSDNSGALSELGRKSFL